MPANALSFGSGQSLIETVSGASLTLTCTTISHITLATRPLFTLSPVPSEFSLLMESDTYNVFNNITRLSGSGSVFAMELTEVPGLHLANAEFINCTSTHTHTVYVDRGIVAPHVACGGAVYFTVTGRGADFSLDSSVSFTLSPSVDTSEDMYSILDENGDTIEHPYFEGILNAPWTNGIA